MLSRILLLVAVASLAQGKSLERREATCNEETFKVCMGAFYMMTDSLQMGSGDLMKHYIAKIKSGIEGFKSVCMGTQMLRMCADNEAGSFESCVSLSTWKARGLDTATAQSSAGLFYMLDNMCSAPMKEVHEQNYDCWKSTQESEAAVLLECTNNYLETHTASHYCGPLQTFLDCSSAPFRQQCGEQMGNAVCQVTHHAFNQLQGHLGCPDVKC